MHNAALAEKDWRKLMYVPTKKDFECTGGSDFGYVRGYNQALDDLEKGGV